MKKFLAIIKYMFFPFLMVQASEVDLRSIIGNEKVTAMAETETTIWVGTGKGLWKINKVNQKAVLLTENNSVLPSNHVNDLCVTSSGNVFAATDKGIFRFDGYANLVINTENSNLPETKITSIQCSKQGDLWIGTDEHGLILMHNNRCKFFNKGNSVLSANNIDSISADNDGNIYAQLANNDLVKIGANNIKLIKESINNHVFAGTN